MPKSLVAMFLITIMICVFTVAGSSHFVLSETTVQTAAIISVQSGSFSFGQSVRINTLVAPPPPTSNDTFTIMLTITNPDGTTQTFQLISNENGSATLDYMPKQSGIYQLVLTYAGQSFANNITYLSSTSPPFKLLIQQGQVTVLQEPVPFPTPSVPEFTATPVGPSVDVPTTYSLNSSSGQIDASIGYHADYSGIEVSIKNQPFTPYFDANSSFPIYLYYNVRIKDHNQMDWQELYNPDLGYLQQSDVDRTNLTVPVSEVSVASQIDVQVQALIGYVHGIWTGGMAIPWVFNGTTSVWSETRTVSLPAIIPLPSPKQISVKYVPAWFYAVIIGLVAVIAILLAIIASMQRKKD